MANLNIKLPKPFDNIRSIAKKSELTVDEGPVLNTLKENHLVVAYNNSDYEPMYYLGFLKSVTFTVDSKQFEVNVIGCEGDIFSSHFDNIKYVSDLDCPKVYFDNGIRPNLGYFIGLVNTESVYKALVRTAPFDTYHTELVDLDSMCFCSDIALGICGKEG